MMRFFQWLFKSRHTEYLEQEVVRLRLEVLTLREWHAQITSNLLQGAGMAGLQITKPEPTVTPKPRMIPSQWRRSMEARDREAEVKKETINGSASST